VKEAESALKRAVDDVRVNMQSEQKEVSRCLAPHVQEALTPGYNRAMEERGTGSVARQKACFHGFVESNKNSIFDDGVETVMDRLGTAAETVGQTLDDALEELAKKVSGLQSPISMPFVLFTHHSAISFDRPYVYSSLSCSEMNRPMTDATCSCPAKLDRSQPRGTLGKDQGRPETGCCTQGTHRAG
jgi:hypothetical protein